MIASLYQKRVGGAARFFHSFSSGLLASGSVAAGAAGLSVVSPVDGRD